MVGDSSAGEHEGTESGSFNSHDDAHISDWIARVLEVRASDKFHVYLRVFWMYREADLPVPCSPQLKHNELIASNHSENLMSLSSAAHQH